MNNWKEKLEKLGVQSCDDYRQYFIKDLIDFIENLLEEAKKEEREEILNRLLLNNLKSLNPCCHLLQKLIINSLKTNQ